MTSPRRQQSPAGLVPLFISEVLLICACFYGAAVVDLELDPSIYFLYEGGIERVGFALVTILLGLYFHHLYSDIRVGSRVFLLQQLCQVVGVALIAQSLLGYLNPDWILPRFMMLYGCGLALIGIFAWRVLYAQFFLKIVGRNRLLFVGRNGTVNEIAREIQNAPERGYEIVGFVDDYDPSAIAPLSGLRALVAKNRPDCIVVGLEDRRKAMPTADLLALRFSGITVEEAGKTYESIYRRVCLRELHPFEVIFSRELNPLPNRFWLQNAVNRGLGLLLCAVSLPFMAIIAAMLRLSSKEPVMERLPRAGKDGVPFTMLRFRQTPGLGMLYRRLHLSAMPELFNVIRGEMALTGPRPVAPSEARELANSLPLYEHRHNVPPGMTGWAQINLVTTDGEYDAALALEYDLYYIKHMSTALSANILMTTLKNRLVWADEI